MPSVPTSSAPVALREPRARGGGDDVAVRRSHHRLIRRNKLTPWLFLAPALAFFSVFKFWPSIWGVYLSFFHVRPYLGDQYTGLDNFTRAFSDPDLRAAVGHTVLDAVSPWPGRC